MPRNIRRQAVAVLDEYIDTGVEGFLTVAAMAKERPLDAEIQFVLRENMEELQDLVQLRNALSESESF